MSAIKKITPLGFPWKTQDPFLFCVYHLDRYPRGNDEMGPVVMPGHRKTGQDFAPNKEGWRMYHGRKVPGFPAHPHAGFETVTIVTEGLVDHADSLGAAGRFGFGDVQWMTAGKGVQHSEMFPLLNKEKENPLELFQIWLNLPREGKKAAPYFSMLWSDTIPIVVETDASGRKTTLRTVAGKSLHNEVPVPPPDSWAADPRNEVAIWIISMEPDASWNLPTATRDANRSLFYFEGDKVSLNGTGYSAGNGFELVPSEDLMIVNGSKPSRLLFLQGRPIGEPVVQHGPFVVNKAEEVEVVMNEYQKTQFGGWPWPTFEHVHPRTRERFARYPDGREETRPIDH